MNRLARLKPKERRELFEETGARRGMAAAIPEKDFWVCWVLKQLFGDPELREQMVFKGGTTLSKVHKVIDRMSEDIDLVLDWRRLGYEESLGEEPRSATQKDKFNQAMDAKAAAYIAGTLLPKILELFAKFEGVSAAMASDNPHCISVNYPAEFREKSLRPEILLEIGPRASWLPSATHSIRPYVADAFPALFSEPECEVVAIDVVRIFWEKATILHQQAHRPERLPPHYSRHYYDLYKLAGSDFGPYATGDRETLAEVVKFKKRFYPAPTARYEAALDGDLRLLPPEGLMRALLSDYAAMRMMFFGEPPSFADILRGLGELEREVNAGAGRSFAR